MPRAAAFLPCALALLVAAPHAAWADSKKPDPQRQMAVELGRQLFFDESLSASGRMSCATCHDPAHAHAQPNALPAQLGGADLDVPGTRSVPSLRYLNREAFFFDKEGTPTAGFNRDGRAASLIEQAERPLLAPHEMANDVAGLAAKVESAPYADRFRALFGANVFADPEGVFLRVRYAIAAFEQEAPELHPFDSKYDAFLRGKVKLAPAELRGLALFNRPDKGNCNACHLSGRGADGSMPVFTDYTYDNLGVPRNDALPANADPEFFDLGLCGPDRSDLAERRDLCGAFKVPTLRNVATRQVFFHNGLFKTLRDAIRFYVRRDTNPEEFYPRAEDGHILKFDDLPADLARNVNTEEVPYERKPGQAPHLDDAEIDDLIAFLGTLTDGYDPVTDTADPARSH